MQVVSFVKNYDWTTLQVKFRGTLRSAFGPTTGPEGFWKILFNGNDCNDPGRIESAHNNQEKDVDHHKASGSMYRELNIVTAKIMITVPLITGAAYWGDDVVVGEAFYAITSILLFENIHLGYFSC